MFAIFGDPEVMRFWSSPPLRDLAAATQLINEIHSSFAARSLFQWGIASRDTDQVIGSCTLFNLNHPNGRAEIGFALARATWGRGYASEAVGLLIRFAFEKLDLHRLEADVDPNNERSLRLLERHGFQREGHLRERWHVLGKRHDTIYMGLLRREWRGGA
jgi:RimJ/RimL family protein N-acetyltransferase